MLHNDFEREPSRTHTPPRNFADAHHSEDAYLRRARERRRRVAKIDRCTWFMRSRTWYRCGLTYLMIHQKIMTSWYLWYMRLHISYIFIPLDSDFGSRKYFEVVRLGTCPVPVWGFVSYRKVILDQNRRNIRNMYILDHDSQIRYIHNKAVDRTNEQIFVKTTTKLLHHCQSLRLSLSWLVHHKSFSTANGLHDRLARWTTGA